MKITSIETLAVAESWLFVVLETDEDITGVGECLPDKALLQASAVESFRHFLIGEDPRRIVHLWEAMYRGSFWRGGPTLNAAISGIEMACWDILGKSLGVPVWQLLGGRVRDRIRMYHHCWGNNPAGTAARAKELVSEGYTAVKFCPVPKMRWTEPYAVVQEVADFVAEVRQAIGFGVDLYLDFHGRVSPPMAIQLEEALRPSRPGFIEEPVLPENVEAMARLATQFKTPIATGERLFTRFDFRRIFETGAAHIVQPDPTACGGIYETRMIGAAAETYYAELAPHNPYGPVAMAACMQIAAATPNFSVQEISRSAALGADYLIEPFVVQDGYISTPEKPGLGVELDLDFCRAHPLEPQIDHARWYHDADGSVAEW
jgi:galactonate dehydratase